MENNLLSDFWYMNLYTIIINFQDRSTGIDQYMTNNPEEALYKFIKSAECLCEYDRSKLLEILKKREKLTIHLKDMKWFWILDFWTDFLENKEFSSIFWWYIIQSDNNWPVRK